MHNFDLDDYKNIQLERLESVKSVANEIGEAERDNKPPKKSKAEETQAKPRRRTKKKGDGPKVLRIPKREQPETIETVENSAAISNEQETTQDPSPERAPAPVLSPAPTWRPLSTDVEQSVYHALMKMAADRKVEGHPEGTHKAITNAALREYIEKSGYGNYLK